MAFAINNMRTKLPRAALLDLKKAYDLVPKAKLQKLIEHRLPVGLSKQLYALLWPMFIQTKGQRSQSHIVTRAGVPQGDPTIPQIFSLSMESFLHATKKRQDDALSSLFVDDVLYLAKSLSHLQTY